MRVRLPSGYKLFGGSTPTVGIDVDGNYVVLVNGENPGGHDSYLLRIKRDGSSVVPELMDEFADVTRGGAGFGPNFGVAVQAFNEDELVIEEFAFQHWATQSSVSIPAPAGGVSEDLTPLKTRIAALENRLAQINTDYNAHNEDRQIWSNMSDRDGRIELLAQRIAELERVVAGVDVLSKHIEDALYAKFEDFLWQKIRDSKNIRGIIRDVVDNHD